MDELKQNLVIEDCVCKLCCKGELPGVASHVFSEFVIREAVNASGKANTNKRDNELLFLLSPVYGVDLFVGRNATQGLLDYLNRDELSSQEVDDLRKKENFITDKYLVCIHCERTFNTVENEFRLIYENLLEENDGDSYDLLEEESIWVELFILLNVWRASASDKIHWCLKPEQHHCLTELMYETFINSSNNNLLERFAQNKQKFHCLDILCFFIAENRSDSQNPNQNFIFMDPSASNPYLIGINRLVIFLSPNNFDMASTPKLAEGVIGRGLFLNAINSRSEKIYFIQDDEVKILYENILENNHEFYVQHVISIYIDIYKKIFKDSPPPEKIQNVNKIANLHLKTIFEYGASKENLFADLGKYILDDLHNVN